MPSKSSLDYNEPMFDNSEAHVNCTQMLAAIGHSLGNYTEEYNACIDFIQSTLPIAVMEEGGFGSAWWPKLLVQILYGLVCLIGLAGNSLVIYVVVRFSKMQTVTNLYILNLAIADECFLVGIPFLVTTAAVGYWPFGNLVCKAYFTTTSINQITSSMFLLIMSADRYLAVCHPISAPKWRTPLIAKTVALTAWTISALLMVPIFLFANTLELNNKINCNIFWPESERMSGEMIFIMYSFVLGFAVPLILILVFYILVIRRLRTVGPKRKPQAVNGNDKSQSSQSHQIRMKERKKSHRKVTKLVLTVITVYFLCWSPYWVSQMALIFMPHESSHSSTVLIVFLIAGCLSYSNSCCNPILYAFLSDNFKKSFKKACSCASRKEVNATLNQENSVFPRKKSNSASNWQRKSSAPLTSATYAGTTIDTTGVRNSIVPSSSPLLASPAAHVPVSKLIPDIDGSSDDLLTATAEMINGSRSNPCTTTIASNPIVHIAINDRFLDNYGGGERATSAVYYSGNGKVTSGKVNETFVQDNGVVVTVL